MNVENLQENENLISCFDFNADCDELCFVSENGTINFIRLHQTNEDQLSIFGKNI